MPKPNKETTTRVRLQARNLFELGKYTQEQICEIIKKDGGSLSRQTLAKWINEDINDIWKVGAKTNDAKEIVNTKIAPQIIDKLNEITPPKPPVQQDKYEDVRSSMIDRQNRIDALTEAFMQDIETNTYKTAYLGILRLQELLLKNKTHYQGKEQTVGYENAKNIDCIANATHKFAQILGLAQGSININNTNVQQNNQLNINNSKDINEEESIIMQKIEEDNKNDNFANLCRVINH